MHSSSADSLPWMLLDHLLKTDEVVKGVSFHGCIRVNR